MRLRLVSLASSRAISRHVLEDRGSRTADISWGVYDGLSRFLSRNATHLGHLHSYVGLFGMTIWPHPAHRNHFPSLRAIKILKLSPSTQYGHRGTLALGIEESPVLKPRRSGKEGQYKATGSAAGDKPLKEMGEDRIQGNKGRFLRVR